MALAEAHRQGRGALRWPLFLGAGLAATSGIVLYDFTCDDSAISYRFAAQFAAGHPLGTVAPGDPVVLGFSNPVWTLLLAGCRTVGLPIAGSAKVLGLAFLVLTAVLSAVLAARLVQRPALAAIGALAGASSTLALWSMSGLENGMVACLLVATTLAAVVDEQEAPSRRRWIGSSLLLALLAISRPDTFVIVPFAVLAKALARVRTGRSWPKAALDAGAWAVLPVATILGGWLYNRQAFGTPLANPVYAKASRSPVERLQDLVDLTAEAKVVTLQFALLLGAAFLLPLVVAARHRHRGPTTTVALLSAASFVLPLTEVDWMVDFRFYATSVPLLLVLAAVGTDSMLERADRAPARRRWPTTAPLVAAALSLWLVSNVQATVRTSDDGYRGQVTAEAIRTLTQPLVRAADRFDLQDPLVMTADAGATTDDLDLRILDMAGLLDPQISHLMDGHLSQRWEYAFGERSPDLIRAQDGAWSWNQRWQLDRASLRALGYVPIDGGTNWVRRDLVIRPAFAAADGLHTVGTGPRLVEAPEAALPGGDLVVRAWVPTEGSTGQRVKFSLSDPQGRRVTTTQTLGSGFSVDDVGPDEPVLHVGRLRVPAGSERLALTVSVGTPGHWSPPARRSIDRGRPAVVGAIARLQDGGRDAPADRLRALVNLGKAAPGSNEADEALARLRSHEGAALRSRIRAAARQPAGDRLRAAAGLVSTIRGRADPTEPWRALGADLQAQAAAAGPDDRYHLLVAAAAADPSSGSIQQDLLASRLARPADPPVDP